MRAAVVAVVAVLLALGVALVASDRDGDGATAGPTTTALDVEPITIESVRTDGSTVTVALAGTPVVGDELFVWRATGTPVAVAFDDGWHGEGDADVRGDDLAVRVTVGGADAIAVSTTSGVRSPDVGHLAPDGPVVIPGAGARAVEEAVAAAEAGYGRLDPDQRAVVRSLLARQLTTGTSTYAVTNGGMVTATVVVTVDYPTISQVSTDGGGRVAALHVEADGIRSCTGPAAAPRCTPVDTLVVPATAAAAMVAAPGSVRVTPLPGGAWNGEPTICFGITSVLGDAGPTPGTSCWLTDGILTEANRENGIVTRLVSR